MESQRGISLIIAFLVMTIMLATVLGLTTVTFNKVKIFSSIGNSISASYAADSGIEKTLYYDRKQIPKQGKNKGVRGLCDICNSCTNCTSCTLTPLSTGGCDTFTCSSCQVTYTTVFNARTYVVQTSGTTSTFFSCASKGSYGDANRTTKVNSTSITAKPEVQ